MMINCSKCGRQLGVNDRFCPDCGERVVLPANEGSSRPNGGPSQKRQSQPAGGTNAGQSSVRYVYVDKKTGKITDSPNSKKGADGCLSFLGVALVAVAVVIAMVAGAVLISSQFSGRSGFSSEDEWSFTEESDQMISSQEVSSSVTWLSRGTAMLLQRTAFAVSSQSSHAQAACSRAKNALSVFSFKRLIL